MKPELIAALIDALECSIATIENRGDTIDLSDLKKILDDAKSNGGERNIGWIAPFELNRLTEGHCAIVAPVRPSDDSVSVFVADSALASPAIDAAPDNLQESK